MRTEIAPVIRLQDYRAPDFCVTSVDMTFHLHPTATKISTILNLRRNPDGFVGTPVVLDGDELTLSRLLLDGKELTLDDYTVSPDRLVIPNPPEHPFTLMIDTIINPSANTKLMGLFRSNGVYCTQCEAEGFRRITYFPDRPDVMAIYRVSIEADVADAPILLSNGNPGRRGIVPGTGRHFAVWDDPFKKPSYLFALVAGDLGTLTDKFVTMSGRTVDLNIYVEKGKEPRAAYAMDSLKRSMKWDEEVFGREYDLDVFNLVAVSDFNMGAMENKGLNVFNDRYVLASAETATDQDYHNIEAIVAHEYFHNWTGNRITCRDWFQLCLKEGLTVFRDQEFSSDMRSRAVERINAVRTLRAAQFVEDAGPLAHPVRPSAFKEISNFYTATVYNKGAEVIRMLKTLIGPANFRKGMDLYFAREDGNAATIEDFIACFADASGQDLSKFFRWYNQAGTPVLKVRQTYDATARTYRLDFEQSIPATPGQPTKEPAVLPITIGLIGQKGEVLAPNQVLVLETRKGTKIFSDIAERPIASLLRGFSAPVQLEFDIEDADLLALARHDQDAFNRWESLQTVAMRLLKRSTAGVRAGNAPLADTRLRDVFNSILADGLSDPAFAALALSLPSEGDIAREIGKDVDPSAIAKALDALLASNAAASLATAVDMYAKLSTPRPFSADAESAGLRALKGVSLSIIAWAERKEGARLALAQYHSATTMTDRFSALGILNRLGGNERDEAFASFEHAYREEPLILDSWFSFNAILRTDDALDRVIELLKHKDFSITNPNRVRSLVGTFVNANPRQFHRPDGEGYRFLAAFITDLDAKNPQVAARLATAFRTFKTLEPGRGLLAESALISIKEHVGISRDLSDIVERALA